MFSKAADLQLATSLKSELLYISFSKTWSFSKYFFYFLGIFTSENIFNECFWPTWNLLWKSFPQNVRCILKTHYQPAADLSRISPGIWLNEIFLLSERLVESNVGQLGLFDHCWIEHKTLNIITMLFFNLTKFCQWSCVNSLNIFC